MTQALLCDECGRLVSDRSAEGEATDSWWLLEQNAIPGAGRAIETVSITVDDGRSYEEEPEPLDLKTWEPARHFCSKACLGSWAQR